MKTIPLSLGFALLTVAFLPWMAGCDKVDHPVVTDNSIDIDTGIVWDDSAQSVLNNGNRFVLIEEFTGHTCPNCPEKSEIVIQLQQDHAPSVVTMSIHAGGFAEVKTSGDKYTTDFRTDAGNQYRLDFAVSSYPRAMISRVKKGSEWALRDVDNNWENGVNDVVNKPSIADIFIVNRYDDSTQIVQNEVVINWNTDQTEPLNLQLYLVEDSIVDWQTDRRQTPQDIPDYHHRHVLRQALNGNYGQKLEFGTVGQQDRIITNFEVPDKIRDLRQCMIVAFIFKPGPDNFDVMQVNEAHILSH